MNSMPLIVYPLTLITIFLCPIIIDINFHFTQTKVRFCFCLRVAKNHW